MINQINKAWHIVINWDGEIRPSFMREEKI